MFRTAHELRIANRFIGFISFPFAYTIGGNLLEKDHALFSGKENNIKNKELKDATFYSSSALAAGCLMTVGTGSLGWMVPGLTLTMIFYSSLTEMELRKIN